MKKDHIRDYASAAFAYWYACGRPDTLQIGDIGELTPIDKLELETVVNTLELLRLNGHTDAANAAEAVYGDTYRARARRGDVSRAVTRYSMRAHRSEACIYRDLATARAVFAYLRGLRLDVYNRDLAYRAVTRAGYAHDAPAEP